MRIDVECDDLELVDAAVAGDADAYGRLVERHEQRVYRFLLKHVMRSDDAEDLAQETFLQAFRSLRHYRGEAKFTTWLIGIALNVARNHANRSPPPPTGDDDDLLRGLAVAADPLESIVRANKLRAVQRALEELPREQRECVSLVLFEGMAYDEASRVLDVPMGTVKSRLARARTRLAELLRDY